MTDTNQYQIDQFNKTMERECRALWAQVYAASCAGQSAPWFNGNGNWNADSSGVQTINSAPGAIDHPTAAAAADTAVHNYRIMVANRLRQEAKPYEWQAPSPITPDAPSPDASVHN